VLEDNLVTITFGYSESLQHGLMSGIEKGVDLGLRAAAQDVKFQ
jgi:hypothetical protein